MANLDRARNKNFTVKQQPVRQCRFWQALTVQAIQLLLLNVMKNMQQWAVCLVAGLLAISAGAEEAALVKKNRVNVRAQATPNSEVITQLKKGETVTVLEEIAARKPKHGEPAKWAKIQLPPNTPVWVYAPYIETTNNTVNIKRLNLRAGPGERFSIIGRIERGTPVKQIRTTDNWMEIEAPTNPYA